MVTAVVLINVERAQVNEVAEALLELKGISEVYSVGGRYDLVAVIRASDNEQLAALVTREMLKLKGISKTETLIAFRAYSRHDLESMFSVGMEEVPPSKKRA
ncbi:MAG TPA: Lrp/AsnC ligand binding domain-containing protein [Elusimicrobiota bacterium]|nr:Lrp/AsnC ligand binding domain-containing protein [Elusimicrobiota bacterium]